MRLALATLAGLILGLAAEHAVADQYAWCAEYSGRSGGSNCYFVTWRSAKPRCRAWAGSAGLARGTPARRNSRGGASGARRSTGRHRRPSLALSEPVVMSASRSLLEVSGQPHSKARFMSTPLVSPSVTERDAFAEEHVTPQMPFNSDTPVISLGFGRSISSSRVGAMSASRPSAMSCAVARAEQEQRHRIGGVRGVRAAGLRVAHQLAVAVIGGDEQRAAGVFDRARRSGRDRRRPSRPP